MCKALRCTRPLGVAGFASGEVGALLRSLECRLVNNCAFFARLRLRFELAACKTLASCSRTSAKSCATDSQAFAEEQDLGPSIAALALLDG